MSQLTDEGIVIFLKEAGFKDPTTATAVLLAQTQGTGDLGADPAAVAKKLFNDTAGGTVWINYPQYKDGSYKTYNVRATSAVKRVNSGAVITINRSIPEQTTSSGTEPGKGGIGIIDATKETIGIIPQAAGNVAKTILSPITSVADFLSKIYGWITDKNNIIRIAYVIGGSIVLVMGLGVLFRKEVSQTVTTVGKVAENAAVAG